MFVRLARRLFLVLIAASLVLWALLHGVAEDAIKATAGPSLTAVMNRWILAALTHPRTAWVILIIFIGVWLLLISFWRGPRIWLDVQAVEPVPLRLGGSDTAPAAKSGPDPCFAQAWFVNHADDASDKSIAKMVSAKFSLFGNTLEFRKRFFVWAKTLAPTHYGFVGVESTWDMHPNDIPANFS